MCTLAVYLLLLFTLFHLIVISVTVIRLCIYWIILNYRFKLQKLNPLREEKEKLAGWLLTCLLAECVHVAWCTMFAWKISQPNLQAIKYNMWHFKCSPFARENHRPGNPDRSTHMFVKSAFVFFCFFFNWFSAVYSRSKQTDIMSTLSSGIRISIWKENQSGVKARRSTSQYAGAPCGPEARAAQSQRAFEK